MTFIKKHKILMAVIILLIILIGFIIFILNMFGIDNSIDVYGPRLSGIEKVEITDETINKLEKELKSKDEVINTSYRLQGRLIYIKITFEEDVSLDTAKDIANTTLEYFDEDEKEYYDIQIVLLKEKEAEGFPKFGYKHKSSEGIVW